MPFISKNIDHSSLRIKEAVSGMWQDFYKELQPFGKMSIYFNDFHSWVADEWTITEVGTSLQKLNDTRNGVLSLISGGTENNGNNMQLGGTGDDETLGEGWAPSAGKNLWFECRIQGNDVDQNDIFCGLHVQDTTVISLGSDYIGFIAVDESASLNCHSAASSVVSSENGIATLADSTFVKLGFKVTGVEKVEYYVNDVLKATITTNIPTALMKLSFSSITGEAAANQLDIDYVVVAQDR